MLMMKKRIETRLRLEARFWKVQVFYYLYSCELSSKGKFLVLGRELSFYQKTAPPIISLTELCGGYSGNSKRCPVVRLMIWIE